ncbi:IclR family transcriptional regulator [Telmatobacter bradus]|uniref:IclR family transcriptional regulator n=1 Tax=Telmatobacter bradus TaxID=474953 RepID=UPI003B42BEC2
MPRTVKQPSVKPEKTVRRRIPQWALHAKENDSGNEQYFLRSISRAIEVLDTFDGKQTLSLKEVSQRTQLSESTAFRVLLTLERCTYLQQQVDGTYQLAPKLQVGWRQEQARKLREKARPELEHLANHFNETVSFACLFDDRIQVLDCVETFHEIRISNRIGRVLPPHCSAMGKAITAFQDRASIDRILEVYGLFPRTPHTIVDRNKLFEEFEQIRKTGFAYDREESVLGGLCIGAVLRTGSSAQVAALSVSTPLSRMSDEREKEIRNAVLESAALIAKLI